MPKPAVLVVEDEQNIQETLSAVLTLVGFKAHRAANVEEALAILNKEQIDALSLDIRMPDPAGLERDGFTLLRYLREQPETSHVPVLLFTGVELTPEEEAMIAGLNAKVFYKPQPYADIIEELTRCLPADLRPPAA
jgi:CheY-like chemotaxis protein